LPQSDFIHAARQPGHHEPNFRLRDRDPITERGGSSKTMTMFVDDRCGSILAVDTKLAFDTAFVYT